MSNRATFIAGAAALPLAACTTQSPFVNAVIQGRPTLSRAQRDALSKLTFKIDKASNSYAAIFDVPVLRTTLNKAGLSHNYSNQATFLSFSDAHSKKLIRSVKQ